MEWIMYGRAERGAYGGQWVKIADGTSEYRHKQASACGAVCQYGTKSKLSGNEQNNQRHHGGIRSGRVYHHPRGSGINQRGN